MNPRSHAVISLVLGFLLGVLKPELFVEIVFVAFVSGTLIDVDHFIVGRFVHGDWRFLKSTFSSFWASVTDVQSVVGEEEEFGPLYRIFSHSVILIVLMIAGFYSDILLIEVAAVSAGVHLLSDLCADVFLW